MRRHEKEIIMKFLDSDEVEWDSWQEMLRMSNIYVASIVTGKQIGRAHV